MNIFRNIVMLCLSALLLQGCGPSQKELWQSEMNAGIVDAKAAVNKLGSLIVNDRISNTRLLQLYAESVKQSRPETAELVDALSRDATTSGPIFQNLLSRLQNVEKSASSAVKGGSAEVSKTLAELYGIEKASTPTLYNMMLTDPLNVLADMSGGQLARVESLSADAAGIVNQSGNLASGNQLVGNPNYGRWQTNSSGNSFWAFYGQYAMLSTLFGRGPIYYNSWSGHRPYSYYHDYGRSTYNSPKQTAIQNSVQSKMESKFSRQGKSFKSPYASQRKTTSRVVNKTMRANQSFQSSYSSRMRSRSSGSLRNSSSRTSRSNRGGK
ncbi:MAG: hypothetical protein R8K48_02855 [Gallionella sp.]